MLNEEWIALFRQLPPAILPKLVLVTHNRTEISVETIFRLEATFTVLRGRVSGTTDSGLLFVLPYDVITNFYINREVDEEEINTIFGAVTPLTAPTVQKSASHHPLKGSSHNGQVPPEVAALRPSMQGSAPSAAAKTAEGPATTARNNLVERLRAARHTSPPRSKGS